MDSIACGGSSIGLQKAQKATVEILLWVGWDQETNALWLKPDQLPQMTVRPINYISIITYSVHLEQIWIDSIIELEPPAFDTWFELGTGTRELNYPTLGQLAWSLPNPSQYTVVKVSWSMLPWYEETFIFQESRARGASYPLNTLNCFEEQCKQELFIREHSWFQDLLLWIYCACGLFIRLIFFFPFRIF